MTDARIAELLRQLDQAFDAPAWHGPTLADAIADLDEAAARWRPAPDAHNAWEYIVHAAYWTYRVLRLVAEAPPAAFDQPGSDFFERPAPGRTLDADRQRLGDWHRRLRTAVAAFDPARLDQTAYNDYSYADVIRGLAAHHLYHAGQIRLLRRLGGTG